MTERDTPTGPESDEPAESAADSTNSSYSDESAVETPKGNEPAAGKPGDISRQSSDDIPREPSKAELDGAIAWPKDKDDDATETAQTFAPKKAAWVALGVLALIMFAMAGIGLSQDAKALQRSYLPVQAQVTAQVLEKDKVVNYTKDETTKAAQRWADQGVTVAPTAAQMADALNAVVSDNKKVTEKQVSDSLKKNKVNLTVPTVDELNSSIRTQTIIFGVVALAAVAAAYFYRQGASWARMLGMFVAGLVTIMFVMQVVNGSLSALTLAIVLSGGAAFFFLMKGRLVAPAPIGGGRPGGAGGGIFGSLFRPRPRSE